MARRKQNRAAHRKVTRRKEVAPTPPRTRQRISRDELLAAAAVVFAEKRYNATSLEDVAAQLGITKSALYHYISNKEELLTGIYDKLIDLIDDSLRPISLEASLSPEERLRRMVHALVKVLIDNIDMASMLTRDETEMSSDNLLRILRRGREQEMHFQRVVAEAQEQGILRQYEPRLVALAIFGMCTFATYWYRFAKFTPDYIAAQFSSLLENGWLKNGEGQVSTWPRPETVDEALEQTVRQIDKSHENIQQLKAEIARAKELLSAGLAERKRGGR